MKKRQQGFTIVELILYGALLVMFLTIVSQMFLSALDVLLESESYVANELDNRYVLSRLTYDIYRANNVITPAPEGVPTDELVLSIGGSTYHYASSGGNLVLATPTGTNQLNSVDTQLSLFEVTRIGVATQSASLHIKITLTAQTVPEQGPQSRTYETTINTRPY